MKSRLEQLLDELLRQIDIPAMEQAMSKQYKSQIRRRWELPADYWMLLERCCGLRTVWSNDTYEALELWGLDTLVKGQEGYAYNPVEQKVIKDWDEHLVVIYGYVCLFVQSLCVDHVVNAQEAIVQNVKHRLQVEKMRLDRLSNTIPEILRQRLCLLPRNIQIRCSLSFLIKHF